MLKSWKVCWSNSCTTAVASVFSSLVPCTRVWGIWSQSCPSDRTQWALSPSDSNVWSFPDCRGWQAAHSPGSKWGWSRASPGPQHRDGEGHWDGGGLQDCLQGRSRQVLRAWGDGWLLKSESRNFHFLGFSTFFPFLSFSTLCNEINKSANFCHECLGGGHQIMRATVVHSYTALCYAFHTSLVVPGRRVWSKSEKREIFIQMWLFQVTKKCSVWKQLIKEAFDFSHFSLIYPFLPSLKNFICVCTFTISPE